MDKPRNVVGPKIRQLRYKAGLTQKQFAAKCQVHGLDISREVLAQIEAQIRWISDFEVIQFCKIFKISPEALLGYSGKKKG